MAGPTNIVWFRQDLRLADNPAFMAAAARGGPWAAPVVGGCITL
jgi:deoxyribodipyrimidine photolyase